ncbi:MAG: methyltransferase domain-containing protein [Verrucomicrobiota bacterium]
MNWKTKARIQNGISRLPEGLSYAAYYAIQRRFGRLQEFEVFRKIRFAGELRERLLANGGSFHGASFLEVGTGRVPMVPIALWLLGAARVVTVDLNPYVVERLTGEAIRELLSRPNRMRKLLGDGLREERVEQLRELVEGKDFSLSRLFELAGIDYRAPGDASKLELGDDSVDVHLSFLVFEHIPAPVLKAVLKEGKRLLSPSGLFLHRIDYSDHFSHRDPSISVINFLQFSEEEWKRYAGNRYMFMNRLRHDDFLALFEGAGLEVIEQDPVVDERAAAQLADGEIELDERFAGKTAEVLAIKNAWIVARGADAPEEASLEEASPE